MKTKTKITSALRALLVCGLLISTSFLMAQPNCNVTINNNLPNCDVELNIRFFELNPTCTDCPGNPISITVSANNSVGILCSDANLWNCDPTLSLCDLSVTFITPTPTNPGPFFFTTGGVQFIGTLPVSCGATSSPNVVINATTIDINP